MKQANIPHEPQQVNNGAAAGTDSAHYAQARMHAGKSEPKQNKLLEANHGQPGKRMDTRDAETAKQSYQAVETVTTVNLAKKPRG